MKQFMLIFLSIVLLITSTPITALATDVDTIPPSLSITTPTGTTEVSPVIVNIAEDFSGNVKEETATYTVSGFITDNVGVSSVKVNEVNATIDVEGNWTADITLKANEVTPIIVIATDTSGNTATVTEYANYRIYEDTDNNFADSDIIDSKNAGDIAATTPILTVTTPTDSNESNPIITDTDTYTVSGTATDVNGVPIVTVNGETVTIGDDGAWTYDLALQEGTVTTVTVTAENNLGNKVEEMIYVKYINSKDETKPELAITTPTGTAETLPVIVNKAGAFSGNAKEEAAIYTVTGTVRDNKGISSVTVNGANATIDSEGNWTADITLKANEVTPIIAVATDTSGNTDAKTEYANYRIYWDTDNNPYTINFVNFEESDIIARYKATKDTGTISATTEYALSDIHSNSIFWGDHPTGDLESRMRFVLAPGDVGKLTKDGKLVMQIYSEKATDAVMQLVFWSESKGAGAAANAIYRSQSSRGTDIKIDWTGTKNIEINFADLTSSNSPSWDTVYFMEIAANKGFANDAVGNAETKIYIQDMYIQLDSPKTDYLGTLEQLYEEKDILQTLDILKSSVALYAGGTHVAVNNEATDTAFMGQKELGGVVGYVNDRVMIPISVFETYFGATTSFDGTDFSISIGEQTFGGTVDQTTYNFGNGVGNLSAAPYVEQNIVYVPGAEVAVLFDIPVCADGRFLLMGTEEAVGAVKRKGNIGVNIIQEIASYLSYYTEQDMSAFTEEDFKLLLGNWKRKLVGNEEINSQSNEFVSSLVANINASASTAKALFLGQDSTSEVSLFNGISMTTSSSSMSQTYTYIRAMALAYATYGSEYYLNEDVLSDVKYCMNWMYERFYRAGSTWKPASDNWYHWDIAVPSAIIDILVVLQEHFTVEECKNYLSYFDKKWAEPGSTGSNWANFCVQILLSGALQNDADRALVGLQNFEKMYLYVDDNKRMTESFLDAERAKYTPIKGAGFFTDGSYVYHTLHPMNQAYGINHFEILCSMEMVTGGTKFEINTPQKNNLVEFFFNNLDTTVFGGTTTYRMFFGKADNDNTWTAGTRTYTSILNCADNYSDSIKNEIYSTVKAAYLKRPDSIWKNVVNFETANELNRILQDDSITPRGERYMNKVYYNQDTVVHEQGDWAFGVQMSSSRIFNYESIDGVNKQGWYLGDGRTEYLLEDNILGSKAVYWSKINKYRWPGTTVDTQERQAISISQGNEYLSSKDFVGGTTLNGTYGVAAMELESYHADKPINGSAGGANPVHTNDLTAKKAYFMFDNGVVCLGTDVNASNNNNAEVLTIVDNKMANSVEAVGQVSDSVPYDIVGVVASAEPEAENLAVHTIDGDYTTKWAAKISAEIIWDLGEIKNCGFISLSFLSGHIRDQYLELQVSKDGSEWESVFDGQTNERTEELQSFDLKAKDARYVKFINKGNSANATGWVSLSECQIYPLNSDGSIGIVIADMYGSDKVIVDGQSIALFGEDYNLNGATWANVADECGYIFFGNDASATSTLGDLKARWTKGSISFFELWYSHGVNPDNGSYSYALLPGMTAEETAQYAENIPVQVLANNSDVQAVYNEELGITGIVFWKAGTFGKITVDKPCIVMYEDNHLEFTIAATDPTQKLESITVTVAEVLNLVSADECATVLSAASLAEGNTTIVLDTLDSVGRTFEASFEKACHNLTKTEANSAGCTVDGNIAYWTCDTCGKLFDNEKGITEIAPVDTVIEKTGHSYKDGVCEICSTKEPDAVEIVVDKTDKGYTLGSDGTAQVYCTGDLEEFVKVEVDGEEVDRSNYSLEEGPTILTFKASYLNTLAPGVHKVKLFYSEDRSAEYDLKVSEKTTVDNDISSDSNTDDEDADDVANDSTEVTVASGAAPTGDNTSYVWLYLLAASVVILLICVKAVFIKMKK